MTAPTKAAQSRAPRLKRRERKQQQLLKWFDAIQNAVFEQFDNGKPLTSQYEHLKSRLPSGSITLDDFWRAFWDKPLWSGISRKAIFPTYEQLRDHRLDWRRLGSGGYSFTVSGRRAHWRSGRYWRATGANAIKYQRQGYTSDIPVSVPVSRLAGIISLAELVHHASKRRRVRDQILLPCRIEELGTVAWQPRVGWIHSQLCAGWSTTTVLHGLTDLGRAIKPDRHFSRAVIWSAGIPAVSSRMSAGEVDRWLAADVHKFMLVDWGLGLAKSIGTTTHLPETLRKIDLVLMNASSLGVVRPGDGRFPGF